MVKLGIFLLTLLGLFMNAQAEKQWGLCTGVESKIPEKMLNVSSMMGLWYEYLITPQLKNNKTYDCGSWLMMQDNKNDTKFMTI